MINRLAELSLALGIMLMCVSLVVIAATGQMDTPPLMWIGGIVAIPGCLIISYTLYRRCLSS